jgi:hypothetical protein
LTGNAGRALIADRAINNREVTSAGQDGFGLAEESKEVLTRLSIAAHFETMR